MSEFEFGDRIVRILSAKKGLRESWSAEAVIRDATTGTVIKRITTVAKHGSEQEAERAARVMAQDWIAANSE